MSTMYIIGHFGDVFFSISSTFNSSFHFTAPMEQKQNRFNLFDLHIEKCVTKIESYSQARMSLLNNMNYM